jgi:endoglucanase
VRLSRRIVVVALVLVAAMIVSASAGAASTVTVQGARLLRNGVPWIPRGVQLVGLVAPDGALSGKYLDAHAHYSPAELSTAVADHADVVRFQVSEFGLDPQGPLYSSAYVSEVQGAVETARSLGLAVIVSLQAEPPAGEPTRCALPDVGAGRAWAELAPMFAGDPDVMFELYNEPGVSATPAGWIQWRSGGEVIFPGGSCQAIGMQALIDEIRAQAPQNVIIVPSLNGEQSLFGRMSLIDPAHRGDPQLAYGIHYPSLPRGIPAWDRTFGNVSGAVPVLVTEWDANSTTGCVPNAPARAQLLLDYLESKRIGIVGFAFDLPGTIVADYTYTPTSYAGFACGVANGGPGQILFAQYAAEAQAGDGTQPDPSPAWVITSATLARIAALDPLTAAHFFNTPRAFVTGAGTASLAALGAPTAVPTESFANAVTLASAVSQGRLRPGTAAVVYAPGRSHGTPVAQQRDPAAYFKLAAGVAHQHGLLLVAAPAVGLVDARFPFSAAGQRYREFLALKLAAGAARYADVFDVPAQGTETDPKRYAAFVLAAGAQAARAHRSVELLSGLNAGSALSPDTSTSLFDAFLKTRLLVSGYGLTDPAGAPTSAGTAVGFLGLLARLEG